jgi:hypothetical protein
MIWLNPDIFCDFMQWLETLVLGGPSYVGTTWAIAHNKTIGFCTCV